MFPDQQSFTQQNHFHIIPGEGKLKRKYLHQTQVIKSAVRSSSQRVSDTRWYLNLCKNVMSINNSNYVIINA